MHALRHNYFMLNTQMVEAPSGQTTWDPTCGHKFGPWIIVGDHEIRHHLPFFWVFPWYFQRGCPATPRLHPSLATGRLRSHRASAKGAESQPAVPATVSGSWHSDGGHGRFKLGSLWGAFEGFIFWTWDEISAVPGCRGLLGCVKWRGEMLGEPRC